jgi:hypothetical protein
MPYWKMFEAKIVAINESCIMGHEQFLTRWALFLYRKSIAYISLWASFRAGALVHQSQSVRHCAEGCMALRWCRKRSHWGTGQHPVCMPSTRMGPCWWWLLFPVLVGLIWATRNVHGKIAKTLAELRYVAYVNIFYGTKRLWWDSVM